MNSRRLDPLLRRAADRESAVARELADKTRNLVSHEQRLADLQRYAAEYAPPSEGVTSPMLLANRHAFRERIEDAVERQAKAVEQSRTNCELERARLMLASRDNKVLEKLAASYRAREARLEERQSQKELDDIAARGMLKFAGDLP